MRLVVLDRDGVINVERREHVRSVAEFEPLPGSLEAIAALCRSGYLVVVATNQSGLARGLYDRNTLDAIHAHLNAALAVRGARIEGFFVCPHAPQDDCLCRKPRPGLLHAIGTRYAVELRSVPVVGDRDRDLDAARAAGARPVLVRTGYGRETEARYRDLAGVEVHPDLAAFAQNLLARG